MPSKSHTEFEYRYIVQGETIWEKIKILKGFLDGRHRAAALEEVSDLKYQAQVSKLAWLKSTNAPEHEQLELQATILEVESFQREQSELWVLNREEITLLERLLEEAYSIANFTRIAGYTDEQMFEANAANEFTMMMARTIQSEIIAQGHPLPATLKNAMCNPHSFNALKAAGLLPSETVMLSEGASPLLIEIKSLEVAE
jgi:hypothetical protein